jgi:hypothetical protein
MTTTAKRLTDLSGDELQQLLDLIAGADSVELKLTVPEVAHRSTAVALGLDPLQAHIRQVFFFDTPDLALERGGIVARARRIQGKAHDSVVKLRPVVPAELPAHLRRSPSLGVELDAMPGGYVCSASVKGKLDQAVVADAVAGRRPLRKLFSKDQRAFFEAHAPEGVTLDELAVLGPIFVLKLAFTPEGSVRRMVAEMWIYPDGSRILELSTKCAPGEAFQVAIEARAFLEARGVDLSGEQQTKTRTALEFFAAQLTSDAKDIG